MRRKGITIVTAVIMALVSATPNFMGNNTAKATSVLWGDVNENGEVEAGDANIILKRYVRSLANKEDYDETVNWSLADVNRDGKIMVDDAQLVLQKYVSHLARKEIYFPVESPIAYTGIYANENWYVYEKPNTSIKQNRVSVVDAFTRIDILEYVGDYWYKCKSYDNSNVYINIPASAWQNNFFYCDDNMEDYNPEATTTTAETTMAATETTITSETTTLMETLTTSETTATTITTETTTTIETTTTSTTTTTTTTETTVMTESSESTTTTTAQPKKTRVKFEVGDIIEFQAVSWWLYSKDSPNEPVAWLRPADTFKILAVKERAESDRYVIDREGQEFVLYVSDTSFFKKIS